MREAILKTGPECQLEGYYCGQLGSYVAPMVYAIVPNGYVMEKLEIAPRTPHLIALMARKLYLQVWKRESVNYDVTGVDYREYHAKLGLIIPPWAIPTQFCMTHGDPTVSNAMLRGDEKELIICDPRPPRAYIPQCAETDMGRLIQSALGWEEVAYGAEHVDWAAPYFWDLPEVRRKALFWCAAACYRIMNKEQNKPISNGKIIDWCSRTSQMCLEMTSGE